MRNEPTDSTESRPLKCDVCSGRGWTQRSFEGMDEDGQPSYEYFDCKCQFCIVCGEPSEGRKYCCEECVRWDNPEEELPKMEGEM